MTKTRTRRTHRRMRGQQSRRRNVRRQQSMRRNVRRQQSRRRNMRRRCGGHWRVQPGTFENVHLYNRNMTNNSSPQNLSENFNENGELTNDQLNGALDATRENQTTPRFVINNIPGITSAQRVGHRLDFYAGDELMGTILISESETGDRGDKPAWMKPYQHAR